MQKSIFIFFCLIVCISLNAQDFQWAIQSEGSGSVEYVTVKKDVSNNVLVAANFTNSVDVNPGAGTLTFNSSGFDDILIMKFSDTGTLIWAKRFGGALMDKVKSLAVDVNNEIVITGYFSGSLDADPGPATSILNSSGVEDIFIIKLDSNGNHIWSRKIGGANSDIATDISLGASHQIICTGTFVNTVDFDPGVGSFPVSSMGLTDGFIEKLDSNGNFIWVKTFGSSHADAANAVAINDSDDIYITGYFKGSVDFDPGVGIASLSSVLSTDDVFILKLDENGMYHWVRQVGGNSVDRGEHIHVDGSGSLMITGTFNTTVDFNPTAGTDLHVSNGGDDFFIMKIDSGGSYQWCNTYGSANNETAGEVDVDGLNRILLTGSFAGTVDFDPGIGTFNLTSAGGTGDIFIQCLLPDGSLNWVENIGGVGTDKGLGLDINQNEELLVCGFFQNTMDADPGIGSTVLNSTSMGDGFLVKFKPCLLYDEIVNQTACDSFLFNGSTYYNSGVYYGTFVSVDGCDSAVTLNLTIYTINTGVGQSGSLLAANQGSAIYQWVWCDSSFTVIPGAIGQYFVADTNGVYAVIIQDNGCVDTSACYAVLDVGINETIDENTYKLYPNPFTGTVTLEGWGNQGVIDVTWYDLTGKILFQSTCDMQDTITMYQPGMLPGIYYLQVKDEKKQIFFKLIKQH